MSTVAEHFGDANWFEPRDDSEASRIFKAMQDVPTGGKLDYDDLDRILGRTFRDNRNPWFAALRRWHREMPNQGTWANLTGIGYQHVAEWSDVKDTGKHHEKKARRQVSKSKQRYTAADQTRMTADEKRERSELLTRVGRLEQAMRSTKAEITLLKRTKADVKDLAAKADATAVDELREKIHALSEQFGKKSDSSD